MTTPPVVSITDELIAELEAAANADPQGAFPIRSAVILALLAERAELKRQLAAASVDAERYRWLRKVTPYWFKKIQDDALTDGGDCLYFHSNRFDAAIDAARNIGSGD